MAIDDAQGKSGDDGFGDDQTVVDHEADAAGEAAGNDERGQLGFVGGLVAGNVVVCRPRFDRRRVKATVRCGAIRFGDNGLNVEVSGDTL